MAAKNTPTNKPNPQKDSTHITYVKRAKMWCKTVITEGKQVLTWSINRDEL